MKVTETAGGIVVNKNGDVAIVSNRGVSWSLPKGKIDQGETDLAAAIREIYEETGITDPTLVRDLGTYERYKNGPGGTEDKNELKKIHIFLFTSTKEKLQPVDSHNPEARWVTKLQALKLLTHARDRDFFQGVIDLI
ncbi:MAG: NUDIX domain-containing protein [Patescibacteria group bacterium]